MAAGPMCKALLNSGRIDEGAIPLCRKICRFRENGPHRSRLGLHDLPGAIDLVDARYAAALGCSIPCDGAAGRCPAQIPGGAVSGARPGTLGARTSPGAPPISSGPSRPPMPLRLTDRQRTVAVLSASPVAGARKHESRTAAGERRAGRAAPQPAQGAHPDRLALRQPADRECDVRPPAPSRQTQTDAHWSRQAEVLDRMSEGVAVVDDARRRTFANDALHSLLGHPHGSLAETLAESLAADPRTWTQLLAARFTGAGRNTTSPPRRHGRAGVDRDLENAVWRPARRRIFVLPRHHGPETGRAHGRRHDGGARRCTWRHIALRDWRRI